MAVANDSAYDPILSNERGHRLVVPHGARPTPSLSTGAEPAGLRRGPVGFEEPDKVAIPIREGRMVVFASRDATEARRVEAMRGDFVADASHELKTPVAAIRAGAETILRAINDDPDDPAAVARFAEQIDRNAIRLGQLVNDLLDLSRLEAEPPLMGPTPS